MLEPPSPLLLQLLKEFGLCARRDLWRCRGRVRRMSHDLPAFDSVWLDALVQNRKLTPFQAQTLESSNPRKLRVGPCVLVSPLGGSIRGGTYFARTIAGRQPCVIKLVDCPEEQREDAYLRCQQLVRKLADFAHPSVVVPHACERVGDRLALVSRPIKGKPLTELLIRRGRFPAVVVQDLFVQLLQGLSTLWTRGFAHGDIRPANVRLTRQGLAVLLDSGVLPALSPELTPHSHLPPDRYDGVAPELIATGLTPHPASDLYALGCLMWQLLAGRPPFPGGDPLGKLAAHQTKVVPDVREWAPETPPRLAETILALTHRDPAMRPSLQTLQKRWGLPRRSGRNRLAAFLKSFSAPPRPIAASRSMTSRPLVWLMLMLFVLSGAAYQLAEQETKSELLQIVHRLQPLLGLGAAAEDELSETGSILEENVAAGLLPLPLPDAQGVIVLDTAGPYEAADVRVVGSLVIQGAADVLPVIEIEDRPLVLAGLQVQLENVILRRSSRPDRKPLASLALIQSQQLTVQGCAFETHPELDDDDSESEGIARPIAVGWKMLDPSDANGGAITVENSSFRGLGPALYVSGIVRQVACRNTLRRGRGTFLELAGGGLPELDVLVRFEAVTCRRTGSLVRCPGVGPLAGKITVEADQCVFDLPPERSALFDLAAARPADGWGNHLAFVGEGCLANPDVTVAVHHPNGMRTLISNGEIDVEGISTGGFEYANATTQSPQDSQIVRFDAPLRSAHPPGISPELLPGGQPVAPVGN